VSARAHPRLVGAFVLGAVALVVSAIALLSSGAWLEKKALYAVFFPGSVKGLDKGAPVTFRGVKVGEVKEVTAFLTGQEHLIQIEVVVEIRRNVVEAPVGMRSFAGLSSEELAQELIKRGLRARMLSASLLTGQRYIDFDFLPKEPARFAGTSRRYPELPTTPTAMEKLSEKAGLFVDKLAELPLDQMLDDVHTALKSLREMLESPDIRGALRGARRSMEVLEPALVEARAALKDADALVQQIGREVEPTTREVRVTASDARETLERARQAMDRLQATLQGTDRTELEATRALAELTQAIAALRNLVEYMETHPEAVVIGKAKAEERK
jgi:phospholipid/cholesterol/gamma-HCH transport system substrate-binding protein